MDPQILREAMLAYEAVYNPELRQELEEKQEFENWVNSLLEEGYDLSEYTWDDMYEAYLEEVPHLKEFFGPGMEKARYGSPERTRRQRLDLGVVSGENKSGYTISKSDKPKPGESTSQWQTRRTQALALADRLNKETGQGKYRKPSESTPTDGSGGSGNQPPAKVVSAKNIAGTSQKVTVGKAYKAIRGGKEVNVTYDASGKRTITDPTPPAQPPAPAPPEAGSGGARRGGSSPAPATGSGGSSPVPTSRPTATGSSASAPAAAPKPSAISVASAERARIRGTQQTDNPLMKDMRSRLPMNSPSVQSPAVATLGKGYQSLSQNPNAFRAAAPKPVAATPAPAPAAAPKPVAATPAPAAAPKPVAATPAASRSTALSQQQIRNRRLNMDYNPFDIVLGHLLDEGYADTEEAALAIMTNMSEEWRESIVEMGETLRGREPKTVGKPERPTALPGETYQERQERMKPKLKEAFNIFVNTMISEGISLDRYSWDEIENVFDDLFEAERARKDPEGYERGEGRRTRQNQSREQQLRGRVMDRMSQMDPEKRKKMLAQMRAVGLDV